MSPTCRSFLDGTAQSGQRRRFHQQPADGRWRSAAGVHVGVQRRREAGAGAEHGGLGRLRRQPRAQQHGRHRHQRGAGRRQRQDHAARRERVRPERRAGAVVRTRRRATPRTSSSTSSRRWRRSTATSTRWKLGLDKRFSNRWSGRVSYTLARCNDVGTSSSTPTRGSTTAGAPVTTGMRSRRARTWTSGRAWAPEWCSACTPAIRSTRRPARIQMATARTTIARSRGSTTSDEAHLVGARLEGRTPSATASTARRRCSWMDGCSTSGGSSAVSGRAVSGGLQSDQSRRTSATRPGTRSSSNFMTTIVADNPRTAQLGFRLTF